MSPLEVHDLSVSYGRLIALREVSMSLAEGETLFVTGPNGAGKSTLLKAVARIASPSRGRIVFCGEDTKDYTPEQMARAGFSMVPEGRHVLGSLSIEENLRLGTGMRQDRDAVARDLEEIYQAFPVLCERRSTTAALLSGGQQQMLVIARALMTGARVLAIDEPSLGLAPKIIDQVFEILMRLRDSRGLTLLIVEQSSTRAVIAGGRMLLLRGGRVVLEGMARELDAESLRRAYFGFEADGSDRVQPGEIRCNT